MEWVYEDSGEFGIYYDVDSDGNIATTATSVNTKSKTITHIKTPQDNEDATKWQAFFSALETLFTFSGELRYYRGKAVLE